MTISHVYLPGFLRSTVEIRIETAKEISGNVSSHATREYRRGIIGATAGSMSNLLSGASLLRHLLKAHTAPVAMRETTVTPTAGM